MDAGAARPSAPSTAAVAGASVADEPRDARVVRELLRSMGLREGEYEPRVVHQFLDLAYRYVGDVLGDAQVYADHAGKAQIDADDVRLAIQAKVNFSFSQPPPREVPILPSLLLNFVKFSLIVAFSLGCVIRSSPRTLVIVLLV
jgi:transcription initiation factor TFIID subunit 9B